MEMKQGIAEKGAGAEIPEEFLVQRFGVPGRGNPAKAVVNRTRVDGP